MAEPRFMVKMAQNGILISGNGGFGAVKVPATGVLEALADLERGPCLVVSAKYAIDQEAANGLLAYMESVVRLKSEANGLEMTPEQVGVASLLSLVGNVWGVQCPWCIGHGEAPGENGELKECTACDGKGTTILPDSQAIEMLQVSEEEYRAVWVDRISGYASLVDGWEQFALGYLMARFAEHGVAN